MLKRKEVENDIYEITRSFAIRIVNMYKYPTETGYWLDLLHETKYLNDETFNSIINDCNRIIAVLTKIVKSSKE